MSVDPPKPKTAESRRLIVLGVLLVALTAFGVWQEQRGRPLKRVRPSIGSQRGRVLDVLETRAKAALVSRGGKVSFLTIWADSNPPPQELTVLLPGGAAPVQVDRRLPTGLLVLVPPTSSPTSPSLDLCPAPLREGETLWLLREDPEGVGLIPGQVESASAGSLRARLDVWPVNFWAHKFKGCALLDSKGRLAAIGVRLMNEEGAEPGPQIQAVSATASDLD